MKLKFYNRLVAEDILDFLNAKTEEITMEKKHIVLQVEKNAWMKYKYESVDKMEADMDDIMLLREAFRKYWG
jgi:competence transcription factor ComK